MDESINGLRPLSPDYSEYMYDPDYFGWSPAVSRGESEEIALKYLEEFGSEYLPENLEYIKNNFHNYMYLKGADTRLAQIYSHLGIYKEENDTYLGYAKKLEDHFDIDTDIFDIASGDYPAFAEKIAKRQIELGCGTVTVIDPAIVCSKKVPYKNMKVYRKCYSSKISVDNYSIITSTLPCFLTETLLNRFICSDKKLFVALCACFNHNEMWPGQRKDTFIRTHEMALDYSFKLFNERGRKGKKKVQKEEERIN